MCEVGPGILRAPNYGMPGGTASLPTLCIIGCRFLVHIAARLVLMIFLRLSRSSSEQCLNELLVGALRAQEVRNH
jgi:hypothetical protein